MQIYYTHGSLNAQLHAFSNLWNSYIDSLLSKAPSTPERFRSKTHQFSSDVVLPSCIHNSTPGKRLFKQDLSKTASVKRDDNG